MIIDAKKAINELEVLQRSNHDDIDQLNKLLASIHQRLSKIYEYAEIEEFLLLRHLTENNLRYIQAAIHGFEKTDVCLEKIIDKYNKALRQHGGSISDLFEKIRALQSAAF